MQIRTYLQMDCSCRVSVAEDLRRDVDGQQKRPVETEI
jgi:hypothetical protein